MSYLLVLRQNGLWSLDVASVPKADLKKLPPMCTVLLVASMGAVNNSDFSSIFLHGYSNKIRHAGFLYMWTVSNYNTTYMACGGAV